MPTGLLPAGRIRSLFGKVIENLQPQTDVIFHHPIFCPEWTVERGTSIEYDSPTLEHYIGRAQDAAEESLPNTK